MAPSAFILPAQSMHTHGSKFIPVERGQLHIMGCVIKFAACKTQEFPILGSRSRREKEAWYDARGGESKVKTAGVSLPKLRTCIATSAPAFHLEDDTFWLRRKVTAMVLPPQPVLELEACSAKDDCIMLLEGEM
jgi:hypothetical protein